MTTSERFDEQQSGPHSVEQAEAPPTYAPAAMALGVMMLLWGVTTMWIMSLAGASVIAWALCIWINEIRKQW